MASSHFFALIFTKQQLNAGLFLREGIQIGVEINSRNALKRTTDKGHPFTALVVDLDYLHALGDARAFLRQFADRPMSQRIALILTGTDADEAKAVADEFDALYIEKLAPRPLLAALHNITGTSSSRGFTLGLIEA